MAHGEGMTKRRRRLALSSVVLLAGLATTGGVMTTCTPTTHGAVASDLGVARTTADLESVVDEPGPVAAETVVGADWEVDRSGLINLNHPEAKAAHLVDGPEPIIIPFHVIRHPRFGLFIVDTGVERALRDDPQHAALSGLAARVMKADKIRVRTDTSSWIAAQKEPLRGVFLTHLHLDHVSGMRDVPDDARVYTGPGESSATGFLNAFVRGPTDAALAGKGALQEWHYAGTGSTTDANAFAGVVDVFGDRTVWAISVPGHTAGSTAYLARTPAGPVLFTGDACHTAWGWEHGVEPGTFSVDQARSADSLARLRAFVARHPRVDVRPGHQLLAHPIAASR
ncbi:MAG: Beta-lactamase-like protein [Myxococcaceae bacterium]|nr:Beta-lactamase-like protein [Myxococcaceae bacterium]